MEIISAVSRVEWILHDFLDETFKSEEGQIFYSAEVINYPVVCPNHGLEHHPVMRINLMFHPSEDNFPSFRSDDVIDIMAAEEDIKKVLIERIDIYRRTLIDVELDQLED